MPINPADIVVGADVPDDSFFGQGFVDDFKTIDTDRGSHPSNYHAGKWKEGFYADGLTRFALIYGHDSKYGPAQINDERQIYPSKNFPHPYGYNGLTLNNEGLVMSSRRVDFSDPLEVAYAKYKGYPMNPDGSRGPFTQNVQAAYISPMLSTYNRYTQGFGLTRATVRVPYGAQYFENDVTRQESMFAAVWGLQAVHRGRGVNGEVLNQNNNDTTYSPARSAFRAGSTNRLEGRYHEPDDMENFGPEFSQIHQTIHAQQFGGTGLDSSPSTISLTQDIMYEPVTVGRITTVEKTGFFINGKFSKVVDTSEEVALGMRIATTEPGQPFTPTGFTDEYQVHDGTTDRRYMQYAHLMNVARDAGLTRSLMRQRYNGGYGIAPCPSTASMFVHKVEMLPLKTSEGNPDVKNVTVNGIFVETDDASYEKHRHRRLD